MLPLINSTAYSETPCYSAPYFEPEIKLNFDQSGLSLNLVNNRGGRKQELSFNVTHHGALELGHAIFSYFGQSYYHKYQRLRQEVALSKQVPEFYSVWVVQFDGDPKRYDWQSGERPLDTSTLRGSCTYWLEWRQYTHAKKYDLNKLER